MGVPPLFALCQALENGSIVGTKDPSASPRPTATMANLLPFHDINVHASASHYAFTSPSTPSAPTLVVDRPTGDLRLNDGALLGGKRGSSIAGILGMIKLRLDKYIIVITKAQPMGRLKGQWCTKSLRPN